MPIIIPVIIVKIWKKFKSAFFSKYKNDQKNVKFMYSNFWTHTEKKKPSLEKVFAKIQ